MSDEILENRAVYSSADGVGWHGKGMEIPADIAKDPRKIAELCGALYTVEKRTLGFASGDGYIAAPGQVALVRVGIGPDTFLAPASASRYHVDLRQPVDIFDAFLEELTKHGLDISHAAVLFNGGLLSVCAKLPEEYSFDVSKGDRINQFLTLFNGYDTKHGRGVMRSTTRVVCANTQAVAESEADRKGTIRRIRASTRAQAGDLAAMIRASAEQAEVSKQSYQSMQAKAISDADVSKYFAKVLDIDLADLGKVDGKGKALISTKSQNMLNALAVAYSKAPGADMAAGTIWGAYNAVTYYATHEKTVRDTSDSGGDAARVAANLFGDSAKLKARAYAEARALVAA